jgi:hypothetical protein
MTQTHLSHFGLTIIGRTNDNVVLCGTLANCKRIAFAHGLEIIKELHPILSMCGGKATENTAKVSGFELSRGLIIKGRDNWTVCIPADVWNEKL